MAHNIRAYQAYSNLGVLVITVVGMWLYFHASRNWVDEFVNLANHSGFTVTETAAGELIAAVGIIVVFGGYFLWIALLHRIFPKTSRELARRRQASERPSGG